MITVSPRPITDKMFPSLNIFAAKSPKMHGRVVSLVGPTLFDAWHLLEFDPAVAAFCERPPYSVAIETKRSREVDFWVEAADGTQRGLIVFGACKRDKLSTVDALSSSVESSGLRCDIWRSTDVERRYVFIRNLRLMRPYLATASADTMVLASTLLSEIRRSPTKSASIADLLQARPGVHPSQIYAAVIALFHCGSLVADLESSPLSPTTLWVAS